MAIGYEQTSINHYHYNVYFMIRFWDFILYLSWVEMF